VSRLVSCICSPFARLGVRLAYDLPSVSGSGAVSCGARTTEACVGVGVGPAGYEVVPGSVEVGGDPSPGRAVLAWFGGRTKTSERRGITVKKKVPVVQVTTPEAAGDLAVMPLEAAVAMADVSAAMREGLLAFATSAGLVVMHQMLTAELTAKIGPKHAKLPASERVGNWHGTTSGQVVLGSQQISVGGVCWGWWRWVCGRLCRCWVGS
jgi:hypothetical protein